MTRYDIEIVPYDVEPITDLINYYRCRYNSHVIDHKYISNIFSIAVARISDDEEKIRLFMGILAIYKNSKSDINVLSLDNFLLMTDYLDNVNLCYDMIFAITCSYQSSEIPEYLLKNHNIDINSSNNLPIVNATSNHSARNVQLLLSSGADISIGVFLHYYIPIDIIKIYVDNGVSPLLILKIIYKSRCITLDILKFLIYSCDNYSVSLDTKLLQKLLESVIFVNGDVDIIQYIIEKGIDPNFDDNILFTSSCAFSDIDVVKLFVDTYGADINARECQALYNAINREHYEIMIYLLEKGAIINSKHILLAIQKSKYSTIYIGTLLEYGCDVNLVIEEYKKLSINSKITKTASILVKNGVDINKLFLDMVQD